MKRTFLIALLACLSLSLCAADWLKQGKPVQLTFGPGNDMEAAVGPDGRIAYENDANGGLEIFILNPATGATELFAGGPPNVMAAYPVWTPDGGLVYALSQPTGTAAVQVPKGGDLGCNLWLYRNGVHRRLTKGLWRDFTPFVSPDGLRVWFTTSRNRRSIGDGSHLAHLELTNDAYPVTERHETAYTGGCAAVSPVISPRGKLVAWAEADGAFANWQIRLSLAEGMDAGQTLTPKDMSCYAPRWSPDGRFLAFTGFKPGDNGWGVWIIEVRTGLLARVATGDGNAKSPCWTPDGKALVYENNATGLYKLYRIDVTLTPPPPPAQEAEEAPPPRETATLDWVEGIPVLKDARGLMQPGESLRNAGVIIKSPSGIDFGEETFFVRGEFQIDELPQGSNSVAALMATFYPFSTAPAWQILVDGEGKIRFTSRACDGTYLDIRSTNAVKKGQPNTLIAVHEPDGHLHLQVNGGPVTSQLLESTGVLKGAQSLTIGCAGGGAFPVKGGFRKLSCGTGFPPEMPRLKSLKELFAEEDK